MPKQNFFVNEDELDDYQVQVQMRKIDRSMIVSGCAGSGKSILALWKANDISKLQANQTFIFIVFTKALIKFMKDGIKYINETKKIGEPKLEENNFVYYEDWKRKGCPSADFIIVDEVQDFTREEISQFKKATKKAFFFWGDTAQSIYPKKKGIPTQDLLSIASEAGILPELLALNHRLKRKVARLAAFLTSDDELVNRCRKEGTALPWILRYKTLEEQLDTAMQQIKNRQITDAAILFPTNPMVIKAYEYLKKKGHSVEAKFDDKQDFSNSKLDLNFDSDNPKLMTYHSAKGLQFEAVFLPECDLPEVMGVKPLYVATTRTYEYLYIMYSNKLSRFFDAVPNNLYSTSLEEARIEL